MVERTRVYRERGSNSCSVEGCKNRYYGSGFCKKHHQWHWKRGLLPKPETVTIRKKIHRNVKIDHETGCWNWQGQLNNKGYGRISLPHQNSRYTHRVAYAEFIGPIPNGLVVCHKCDNPQCCNPRHLFVGTFRQNMQDAKSKGRLKQPGPMLGCDHPRALFSIRQVNDIRRDSRPMSVIAREHGCSRETIRRVQDWETYGNVACECCYPAIEVGR